MTSSIANLVTPELPYLRRFAQALTGSRIQGDAYVAATLEAIIAGHGRFDAPFPPRIALYRLFQQIWSSLQADGARREPRAPASQRIEQLPPKARQAFLLAALDEFSPGEIALILDVGESEAEQLVASASAEIARQIATRVLVIEDELLTALEMEQIVTDIGHKVVGVAKTRQEAVALAASTRPGIVLADVRLADGSSGVDAVNGILQAREMPVIFVTAYPERLKSRNRPGSALVIAKPFHPSSVKAAMSKALFFNERATRAPDRLAF